MTAIFLSHSSKDNAAAGELKIWLEAEPRNHSVFLDFDPEAGIKGGANWEQTLYERLRICRVVIPLLTPDWLSSKWCFAEVVQARSNGKAIVPLKVADCDALNVFPAIQQIDLTHDAEEGYQRLELSLREVFSWNESRAPYPGLLAFQEDDAAVFFGRTSETSTVIETLESMRRQGATAPHFALVLGASGSGKSSLVRAGVVPRLRARGGWLPIPAFRPREDPLSELAAAIAQAYERVQRPCDYAKIYAELHKAAGKGPPEGGGLVEMGRDLAIKAQRGDATVLLVVDQAEELFGESGGEQADRFLGLIRAALERSDGRLMGLATMRSGFLGAFQTHPFLLDPAYPEAFAYEEITVDPLPVDRFTEIIRGPADLASLAIDDELVERMVKDTGTRDALPLLAYTLRRLWDNETCRANGRFELAEYEEFGGLGGSVRKAADEALGVRDLQPNQMEVLRAAFIPAMVRVGVDGARVRRRAYRDELARGAEKPVQRFIGARLLVTDRDREGRETVEVTHEALLRVWPQLDAWLEEDQDKLRLFESIRGAAEEWQRGDCVSELLVHRGERLAAALTLVREPRFTLRPESLEAEYLEGCDAEQRAREEAEREERERRVRDAERIAKEQQKTARRTRIAAVVASLLMIFACSAAVYAFLQEKEADVRRAEANQQRNEARSLLWFNSARESEGSPLAIALALEANRIESPPPRSNY
jgi:hypothetical protein